jgi:prolyl oligopeptidase PreP (S9A serine peptidase family)
MTREQIAWAASHDWFRYATLAEGAVWVQDYEDNNHEKPVEVKFTNYNLLVEWAGY